MTSAIEFKDVSRHYGEVRALDRVSFHVTDGEFFSMLGPSGSGKTTSLRLIAGFETPTSGVVSIHGSPTLGVPPYERNVNTVFQDYALFPHMSILQNVAYGLMVKGVKKVEYTRRAHEMLELVKLPTLADRRPVQLSGGQRQRIALARALINRPRVLLLDEPLGALDLKLRKQMQIELKRLQRHLGITFIYVTHDQDEALSMSDRLAVFRRGGIEQVGTPREVYEHPSSAFVADFVGDANVLEGKVAERLAGKPCVCSIRPEKISFVASGSECGQGVCTVTGTVADIHYHGASTRFTIELPEGDSMVLVRQPDETNSGTLAGVEPGSTRTIGWDSADMRVYDAAASTGQHPAQ